MTLTVPQKSVKQAAAPPDALPQRAPEGAAKHSSLKHERSSPSDNVACKYIHAGMHSQSATSV